MSTWTLLLVALGVSADAFAVSASRGVTLRRSPLREGLLLAMTFGVFQAVMPLLGWAVGSSLADYITSVDHWIAFGLLALVGGRMLYGALRGGEVADEVAPGRVSVRERLVLGLATSIDALAVGIGLAFTDLEIWLTVVVIGVTTFGLSLLGVRVGQRSGARFGAAAEVVGGLVLIGIGTRILLTHLHVV